MKRLLIITMMMLSLVGCNAQSVLAPADYQEALCHDPNGLLLDVRKADEYAAGHLDGALNMDWLNTQRFKEQAATLDTNKTLYLYCRSGRRSAAAAKYLTDLGFKTIDLQGGILAWQQAGFPTTTYESDVFFTRNGKRIVVTPIKHGTLMLSLDGKVLHIDPVAMFGTDYSRLPKADAILVTHDHQDHYDAALVQRISKDGTLLIHGNLKAGKSRRLGDITITATPAYNITDGHTQFHPKGVGVGFIIEMDGFRIYVAGDTEDIPEMSSLHSPDLAFLPVNQPYTMTPSQCIHAIEMCRPRIVYPYHFGETDLTPITDRFANDSTIEIRIKPLQ